MATMLQEQAVFDETRYHRFELRPLTGTLGADITGVDLSGEIDEVLTGEIRSALARYHVLAIRDQKLTPETLHRFARRLGPFSGNPIHVPIEGFDDIVRFVRDERDTGPVIGESWHMDLAWLECPPGITVLYGDEIPDVGGDTLFASLEAAYDALSARMKALLEDLVGVHSGKGVFDVNAALLAVRGEGRNADDVETEHPLVCRHPVTGRRHLFISGVLRRFVGMTEAESRPIIDFLLRHAVRPELTCRVRWSTGALVLWDNPCLLHAAINDYPGKRRVVYRTTVEGSRPAA
jgi:alpha-ketoglutarate-dependent taurine dioxygenase